MNGRAASWKRWALTVARVLIGGVFVYSGWSKLSRPSEFFQLAINLYDVVPTALTPAVSVALPWIELVFGSFLLVGYGTRRSAWVLSGLAGCFSLLLMQAILRNLPIDHCGCFGEGIALTLFQSLLLDTAMLLTLLQIESAGRLPCSLDALLAGAPPADPT